jgi:hypothetical protein
MHDILAFFCVSLYRQCGGDGFTEQEKLYFADMMRYALLSISFWRFRQFHVRKPDASRQSAHEAMVRRFHAVADDANNYADILNSL